MACSEPACIYPEIRDGLCAHHWNEKFSNEHLWLGRKQTKVPDADDFPTVEEAKRAPRPINTPAPKLEPKPNYKVVPNPKGRTGSKWAWLFDLIGDQNKLHIRAEDHGLTPGYRDAGRIRAMLATAKATSKYRWSVFQTEDGFDVERLGQYAITQTPDGGPKEIVEPLPPKDPPKPKPPSALKRIGANDLRAELEALLEKLHPEYDAAVERAGKLSKQIEAVKTCIDLL